MTAHSPVDDWRPPWSSFRDFVLDRATAADDYLTELDHESGTRQAWTRTQWLRRVGGVATEFATRGVRSGDTVAMLAGNAADALAVAFACWVSGICYLPLNLQDNDGRHEFLLRDSGASLLVHSPAGVDRGAALAAATGIASVAAADLPADGDLPPDGGADLSATALRVYTSGTTGAPKGVALSARNLLTDADGLARALGWDGDTRVLVVLPIHHVNGLVLSSLVSWYAGSSAVLCDRFRSERFWSDVADEGATVCSMVPTLLEFLLAAGTRPAPDGFTEVLCGAGPLMPDTVLAFERGFGVPVRHLYGLSETTAVATLMPATSDAQRRSWYADHGFPSIGPAIPHVQVDVHDQEGQRCADGQRGELVVRGATVMDGYAGRPDATTDVLRDGWFHSGDEGFRQPADDGTPYFFVTGRLKELIIRGGVNISPFTVDEVLAAHPAVRFGLAVPFANRYYGEEIAAYVVAGQPVTEQEILDFCAERLDFASCPKVVLFGADVPFTATGKAKRLDLATSVRDQLAAYHDVQFRRHDRAAGRPEEVSTS